MKASSDGTWAATVELEPGPYQYKFVVNGTNWLADPSEKLTIPPDGNTPLWVGPSGRMDLTAGDSVSPRAYALSHQPGDVLRLSKTETRFTLSAGAGDLDAAFIEIRDDSSGTVERTLAMRMVSSNGMEDAFTVAVPNAQIISYTFRLRKGQNLFCYDAKGLVAGGRAETPFRVDPQRLPLFETPAWVRETIWYQIFPERFHNGQKANDIPPPKGIAEWTTPLSEVSGNPNDFWWGGDLKGITKKIPYLRELGINGIYLTPVFEGPDTHKYATTDYKKIAREFGTEEDFKTLVETAHRNGMRVMLDAVFNHTSVYFPAFRDILEKQEKSPYAKWYHVRRFPVLDPVTHYQGEEERKIPYDGWWGIKWMPKLDPTHPEVEKFLLDVSRHWIQTAGIDGWRLDVANEVDSRFWRKFRTAVKGVNPDAVIIGEIWEDASPWLQGDQFDGVMNYRFRAAVLDFFARGTIDGARFASLIEALYHAYPPQASAVMFNLLGSHDTPRIVNEAGGNARRAALATLFQMTWPGAPSVYYGDEIGLPGAGDPHNRAPMDWNKANWNPVMTDAVRRAIALRRKHPSLRGDSFQTLHAPVGRRVAAFLRTGNDETAVTVFNASDSEQVITFAVPPSVTTRTWTDVWANRSVNTTNGTISMPLPAYSAAVLLTQ